MPQFKAPPIPSKEPPVPSSEQLIKPAFSSPAPQTNYTDSIEMPQPGFEENSVYDGTIVSKVFPRMLQTKIVALILGGLFVFGMIVGALMFGGSSTQSPQQQSGLTGVITNPDIKERLYRCGQVDKGEACVLYIVNHTRYDRIAEDFFDEAVKLTEAQRYSIAMVNPKYAKTRIPPGYFAQIKIPNVR